MRRAVHPTSGTEPRLLSKVLIYLACTCAGLICMLPIVSVLAVSLSSNIAVSANRVTFYPVDFSFQSYALILSNKFVLNSFRISALRVLLGVCVSTVLTVMMAYPLSKPAKLYPTRRIYIGVLLLCMLFNGGLVPTYILVASWLGLKNCLLALVLPAAVPIFNVILVMNFIRSLPKEIEEAAYVDGASHIQTLTRIILPVSKPVIATIILFQFVFHWNEWFMGMIYMSDMRLYPLQTTLQATVKAPSVSSILDMQNFLKVNDRTLKAAQIFVTMIPMLVIYPFLQKYFTTGIVLGSVKG